MPKVNEITEVSLDDDYEYTELVDEGPRPDEALDFEQERAEQGDEDVDTSDTLLYASDDAIMLLKEAADTIAGWDAKAPSTIVVQRYIAHFLADESIDDFCNHCADMMEESVDNYWPVILTVQRWMQQCVTAVRLSIDAATKFIPAASDIASKRPAPAGCEDPNEARAAVEDEEIRILEEAHDALEAVFVVLRGKFDSSIPTHKFPKAVRRTVETLRSGVPYGSMVMQRNRYASAKWEGIYDAEVAVAQNRLQQEERQTMEAETLQRFTRPIRRVSGLVQRKRG